MWWSKALLAVALLVLGPVGCGFHPLYGQRDAGGPVSAELAAIRIGPVVVSSLQEASTARNGQVLRNALLERMNVKGEPVQAQYLLAVEVSENIGSLAESQDGKTTIGNVGLTVKFRLDSLQNSTPENRRLGVVSGSARSIIDYRYAGPRYASVAGERDAEDRALRDLADSITNQLAAALSARKQDAATGSSR